MDSKFHPAIAAIKSGNIERLRSILRDDPTLATARSSCSHPTLLQCLALDAIDVPNNVEMASLLIDAGAEINGPLVAAASINNVPVLSALLDAGGAINGTGDWTPLEESLYWGHKEATELLLERGAPANNLRTAAALGRVNLIKAFFNSDGSLKPEAGKIAWPFTDLQRSSIQATVSSWRHTPREIINNAFVYACMHNQLEAAQLLLDHGAEINTIPPGFDYAGTALHYAALNGHRQMVEFLVSHGADPKVKDTKVDALPAGWAEHGGHPELKKYLDGLVSDML
jgi:ankyrin repeat protein